MRSARGLQSVECFLYFPWAGVFSYFISPLNSHTSSSVLCTPRVRAEQDLAPGRARPYTLGGAQHRKVREYFLSSRYPSIRRLTNSLF